MTAGLLALAWVLSRGDDVVPIPGTKRRRYLKENIAAGAIAFTAKELAAIAPLGAAAGLRSPPATMASVAR